MACSSAAPSRTRLSGRRRQQSPGAARRAGGGDRAGLPRLHRALPEGSPIFALDRVRFVGEAVAAVAADTPRSREQAVDLIEVAYEALPGVFDPEFGASAEAPVLHPELANYESRAVHLPAARHQHLQLVQGAERRHGPRVAEADLIYEHKYRVPHIQHVPLETHICVAQQDVNGKITLWSSSQSPFAERNLIAKALHISHSKLRVITPYVGGGFGCKAGVSMEGAAVALAMKAKGRPVKLRMTREEEFYTTFVRQGLVAYVKMGMTGTAASPPCRTASIGMAAPAPSTGQHHPRRGYSGTGPILRTEHPRGQYVRLHQSPRRRRDARVRHAGDPLGHRAAHRPDGRPDGIGPRAGAAVELPQGRR